MLTITQSIFAHSWRHPPHFADTILYPLCVHIRFAHAVKFAPGFVHAKLLKDEAQSFLLLTIECISLDSIFTKDKLYSQGVVNALEPVFGK